MASPLFTVFTPTFNRAHTLHRVHESLASQTFRDFEWVIVDDGSLDGTGDRVAEWAKESPFPIRYFWQDNAGKAEATNNALREAHGELFLTLDSDDACVPHALERFAHHWNEILSLGPARSSTYSAVTALCEDQHGKLVGSRFPTDVFDSNSLELRYRHRVVGEKWGFQKTSVLRDHPFIKAPDGSFVPESVVWNAIARDYSTRYVNEILRIYWTDGDDRLTTKPQDHTSSMLGHAIAWRADLDSAATYFFTAPKPVMTVAAQYAYCSFLSGISPLQQVRALHGVASRVLWAGAVLPGWMYVQFAKRRAR